MKKNNYGTVRYVRRYLDAPKNAMYIVREILSYGVVFEKYNENGYSEEIAKFPLSVYLVSCKDEFYLMLEECRKIIGNGKGKCIWVEKPIWKYPYPKMSYNGCDFECEELGMECKNCKFDCYYASYPDEISQD